MPQLPITSAVSPTNIAGINQASTFSSGEDVRSPGHDFGSVLARQLQGGASRIEQKEDAPHFVVSVDESAEPSTVAGEEVLPVDLSVASVAEGVDELERVLRPSYEVVLTAPLFEKKQDARLSAVVVNESAENEEVTHLADVSALTSSDAAGGLLNLALVPVLSVVPGVGSAEWGGAVDEKMVWMANQSHQVDELLSNPRNLWPLVSDSQASALFVPPNSTVREAIEVALPRSREMFADSGIMLERKEGKGLSFAVFNESAESAVSTGAEVLSVPVSMFFPASGLGGQVEASSGKRLMKLSTAGESQLGAEIAANGKNLPQAMSSEQRFSANIAALEEDSVGKVGGETHSTDLFAASNSSATAVVFRNSEAAPALPVTPKVGSAEWGGAVGEKVVWMANQSHQVAELHLNPPNLGPLEVRLTVSNDQASALFVSPHSAVREAIEAALPRLREMLADNGIMLGNVTVGSESFSQQQAADHRSGKEGGRGVLRAGDATTRIAVLARHDGLVHDGMVDIFA